MGWLPEDEAKLLSTWSELWPGEPTELQMEIFVRKLSRLPARTVWEAMVELYDDRDDQDFRPNVGKIYQLARPSVEDTRTKLIEEEQLTLAEALESAPDEARQTILEKLKDFGKAPKRERTRRRR